jgi:beta-catenin-like protein 1
MEEAEFMENCFNALCGVLAEPESKKIFNDAEGIELMVILLK